MLFSSSTASRSRSSSICLVPDSESSFIVAFGIVYVLLADISGAEAPTGCKIVDLADDLSLSIVSIKVSTFSLIAGVEISVSAAIKNIHFL